MEQDTSIRSADLDLGFIDLNTATEHEIASIPWIEPELARSLVQHRPYKSFDDLKNVPGFTEDIVDMLRRGGATLGSSTPIKGL